MTVSSDASSGPGKSSAYLAHTLEAIPAADAAQMLAQLAPDEAAKVAEYLDPKTASSVLSRMDPFAAAVVISAMEAPEASMVLSEMDPDDRVDLIGHLEQGKRETLLDEMNVADVADIRRLRQYPSDTAGGIMTSEVTSLPDELTVQQAIEELRRLNEQLEQMFYVYVVDMYKHLVGVLSMRDLLLAKPDRKIRDIMHRQVTSV